jgi:hypothetical protein
MASKLSVGGLASAESFQVFTVSYTTLKTAVASLEVTMATRNVDYLSRVVAQRLEKVKTYN